MEKHKRSTGIAGLDDVLVGGYINRGITLIKGGPGTGKTIMSVLFALSEIETDNKCLYITCDEAPNRIQNYLANFVRDKLTIKRKSNLLFMDLRPRTIEEINGEYELSMVLLRIKSKLKQHPNATVIIDSLQNLMAGFNQEKIYIEIIKLFDWLRENKSLALVTTGETDLILKSKNFEEYSVDCLIVLHQRYKNTFMTRYLAVEKQRGSSHGTNEYPFIIRSTGISLIPITSTATSSLTTTTKKFSTGIKGLDEIIGGGIKECTSIMFSGTSGSGKTIFLASISESLLKNNKQVLFISFEESGESIAYNTSVCGIHLTQYLKSEQLKIVSRRSVETGLEGHVIAIFDLAKKYSAHTVIIDSISSLVDMGTGLEVKNSLVKLIASLRILQSTVIFSQLIGQKIDVRESINISSLVDTWILLKNQQSLGEYNREIHIIKSRGSKTSNQIKEFKIKDQGIVIETPYLSGGRLVFGNEKQALIDQTKQHIRKKELEIKQAAKLLKALHIKQKTKKVADDLENEENIKNLENKLENLEDELKKSKMVLKNNGAKLDLGRK